MKHKILLEISMEVEYDGDNPEFIFEDHKCLNDLVKILHERVQEADEKKTCICYMGEVHYKGRVDEGG